MKVKVSLHASTPCLIPLGSIFYHLKEKLWATSLSAGLSSSYRDFEFFSVTIELTPEGFGSKIAKILTLSEHIEEVIATVFEYIGVINREGVKKHLWDEVYSLVTTSDFH